MSDSDSGNITAAEATVDDALGVDVDEAAAAVDADLTELELLERERDEYLDALRRLQADFENYKKRIIKQQTDLLERAAQALVEKLLPVLDAADLARAHGSVDAAAGPVAGLLLDTLAREGLEVVGPLPGAEFDPTVHEAVAHEPASDDDDAGAVVADLLRPGYRWKTVLLRPAMVKVRGQRARMAQAAREWFEKDYYKVLGVGPDATEKDIQRAYRKLAKQFHPDANPGDKSAEERFKEANAANDVLSDPAKRKEYDEVRRMGPGAAFGAGGAGGGADFGTFRVDDLGDILGGLFNRGGTRTARGRSGRGAPGTATGPRRGDDLEAELHLDFEAAVSGITTSVSVYSDVACNTCHGSGAAPGTSPVICSVCGGRGVVDDNQGFFSFSTPCRACRGTGMRVDTPCPTCSGTGVERRQRNVKVRIPAGVVDGQRIRVGGRGAAGPNGGPSGDLYVVCRVAPHELFGQQGRDLTITVPVTFAEAALGATVTVPTLSTPVRMKVPAGSRSGRVLRVRGRGVAGASGVPAGDLLVTIEVVVPERLSDAERAAIEQLQSVSSSGDPRAYLGKWIDG